jgi:hypothetical protein
MSNELKLYFKILVSNSTTPNYKQFSIKTKTNFVSNDVSTVRTINMYMCDENGNTNNDIISFFINDVAQRNLQDEIFIPHVTYTTIMIRKNYAKQIALDYDFFCASGYYNGLFSDQSIYKFTAYKICSGGIFAEYNASYVSIKFIENLGTITLKKNMYIVDPTPYLNDNTDEKIILYYRRGYYDINGNRRPLKSDVNYSFDVTDNLLSRNSYYSGLSALRMSNSTWDIINDDMITFFGSETPQTKYQNVPFIYDAYNENVMIRLNWSNQNVDDYSLIIGESLYNNGGTGENTTVLDIVTYYVTVASGVFYGYKKITIYFDNVNMVRKIEILK